MQNTSSVRLGHAVAALLGFFILLSGIGLFGPSSLWAEQDTLDKVIQVREKEKPLKISLSPLRSSYRVDESIRFTVLGNKPFYLYLFSINQEEKRAVLLIPNARQRNNKFSPNQQYILPKSSLEFYADRPGREKVVAVATSKPVNLNKKAFDQTGPFFRSSAETAEARIKALQVRASREKNEKTVEKVFLKVH